MEEILHRLVPVFREVFDDPGLTVDRGTNASTVDGWDSLAHVNLVTDVEATFGVRFALGELVELQDVGDMVDLIARKLGQ
jgi:acyl carrier protein